MTTSTSWTQEANRPKPRHPLPERQSRYLTWKRESKSPFAPKDAERQYREIFYELARNPSKELFAEWGTHNRVWGRYVIQKIARVFTEKDRKPIDPRVIEYTNYHDKLVGEVGDATVASANYHSVFLNRAYTLYFHTGDWDAFLHNKGFVKTLRRYVEMVAPSGACPQFGSCSGWPAVGSSMWHDELASTITRDGRFKWTARRIAEYYYNHLDYRAQQYHLPYDTARNNFTLAYLSADDSVEPEAPPAGSRITWRHLIVPTTLEERKKRPGLAAQLLVPDRWIPDKVVLTSGNEPQSLWVWLSFFPEVDTQTKSQLTSSHSSFTTPLY